MHSDRSLKYTARMQTPETIASTIDIQRIRSCFPALESGTVFLENAGGSQVPAIVADAIHRYMIEDYVQLGAGYEVANRSDKVIDDAHDLISLFMNANETGEVLLGPSTTQLCTMLAGCYGDILEPGDEIIVTQAGHEANIGPWKKLADRGMNIRMWEFDTGSMTSRIEDLQAMLNERTRIVAFVHVSNLLGEIVDVQEITRIVHAAGARVAVDGVAYAPHRAIDVAAWDVDWYFYSAYKVYGPHMAVLYGRHDAFAELTGPNHFFVPSDEVPYKFELGGVNHEGCAGLVALGEYLRLLASMAGHDEASPLDRQAVEAACSIMTACEAPVQRRLIEYLAGEPSVRIIGPAETSSENRVGTVSFVHDSKTSAEIAAAAHTHNFGVRNGHNYAYRLCDALGLDPEDGVVRVSAVHYNTVEEIDGLIEVLRGVL